MDRNLSDVRQKATKSSHAAPEKCVLRSTRYRAELQLAAGGTSDKKSPIRYINARISRRTSTKCLQTPRGVGNH